MASKRRMFPLLFMLLFIYASIITPAGAQQLDIPARLQWDENNGYCGETSVQQAALYYGTYASQYRLREILDPTQQQDLWVETSGPILEALRLTYAPWDYDTEEIPQFRNFMVWVKQHIHDSHPVIMAVYYRLGSWGEEYDHIVLAIGAHSQDFTRYYPRDELSFNDNYGDEPITRSFWTLSSSRLMLLRGLVFDYCVPRRHDYGIAVTGIRDDGGSALPVSITLDRWDEPNIIAQEDPEEFAAEIKVSSLESGQKYALLRYDSYSAVPAGDFLTSSFTSKHEFTATGATYTYEDTFQSDSIITYRCVSAGI